MNKSTEMRETMGIAAEYIRRLDMAYHLAAGFSSAVSVVLVKEAEKGKKKEEELTKRRKMQWKMGEALQALSRVVEATLVVPPLSCRYSHAHLQILQRLGSPEI